MKKGSPVFARLPLKVNKIMQTTILQIIEAVYIVSLSVACVIVLVDAFQASDEFYLSKKEQRDASKWMIGAAFLFVVAGVMKLCKWIVNGLYD